MVRGGKFQGQALYTFAYVCTQGPIEALLKGFFNMCFALTIVVNRMLLKRGMENGEWGMGNGEWGMGNGEWGMGN